MTGIAAFKRVRLANGKAAWQQQRGRAQVTFHCIGRGRRANYRIAWNSLDDLRGGVEQVESFYAAMQRAGKIFDDLCK